MGNLNSKTFKCEGPIRYINLVQDPKTGYFSGLNSEISCAAKQCLLGDIKSQCASSETGFTNLSIFKDAKGRIVKVVVIDPTKQFVMEPSAYNANDRLVETSQVIAFTTPKNVRLRYQGSDAALTDITFEDIKDKDGKPMADVNATRGLSTRDAGAQMQTPSVLSKMWNGSAGAAPQPAFQRNWQTSGSRALKMDEAKQVLGALAVVAAGYIFTML